MEIGNGTLLHSGCLEAMAGFADGSIDLVVTSPPYDNLRTYNDMPPFTFETFQPIARELARLIKPGGVIVWNVADATVNGSETGSSFRQALYFKDECGLNLHDTMIWQKPNYVPLTHNRYEQSFEYMFIFSKGKPHVFSPIKIPSKHAGAVQTKRTFYQTSDVNTPTAAHSNRAVSADKIQPNVWVIATGGGIKGHPAQFPLRVSHDHIISWSNPGDVILDPFMGSGTTAIAAERSGRRWIGIERDEGYYNAALARIYAETSS